MLAIASQWPTCAKALFRETPSPGFSDVKFNE
jgi:hypothetical protein